MIGEASTNMNGSGPQDDNQKGWPVHLEVRLTSRTSINPENIRKLVRQHVQDNYESLILPSVLTGWETSATLGNNVSRIVVSESACPLQTIPVEQCSLHIHVYQPSEDSTYDRMSANPSDPNEEYTAGTMTDLPSKELEGLWESLFYEGNIKTKLLDYIYATTVFSDADVDFNLVSWNRVILLHGPPGTGKTSLCRALAQKLSIRLKDRYKRTHLFEINSHSLFSRWFSESGKLVQGLFSTVNELASEEEDFVVLLIDEVESLTAARAGAMSGTEPSDALRVVNALLTQIDRLKLQKNVLIMATSNLAKAIDSAFVDRADIAQYIDYPPPEAIYEILRSSLVELMAKGVITKIDVPAAETARLSYKVGNHTIIDSTEQNTLNVLSQLSLATTTNAGDKPELSRNIGSSLYAIAEKCRGVSGRSLRRLPVLAYARYISLMPVPKNASTAKRHGSSASSHSSTKPEPVAVEVWLNAMQRIVIDEAGNREHFNKF